MRVQYATEQLSAEEYDAAYEQARHEDLGVPAPQGKVRGLPVPCFRCGETYTRRRSNGRYCKTCKETVRGIRNTENMRRTRAAMKEALPRAVREPAPALVQRIDSLTEQDLRKIKGLIPDTMPAGSQSPYGSEDGRSTYDKEFADELDGLSWYASLNRWWTDNPHWAVGLYEG